MRRSKWPVRSHSLAIALVFSPLLLLPLLLSLVSSRISAKNLRKPRCGSLHSGLLAKNVGALDGAPVGDGVGWAEGEAVGRAVGAVLG